MQVFRAGLELADLVNQEISRYGRNHRSRLGRSVFIVQFLDLFFQRVFIVDSGHITERVFYQAGQQFMLDQCKNDTDAGKAENHEKRVMRSTVDFSRITQKL